MAYPLRAPAFLLAALALMILAACQAEADKAPPATLAASTPLADLRLTDPRTDGLPTAVPESVVLQADAEYLLLTNLYARATVSVVSIEVVVTEAGFSETSRGSGFVYDRSGHIVTNAHVINAADEIRVIFHDGYVTDAEIVGQDNYSDLAVIQVDVPLTRLVPLTLANSDLVRVGERAIVIGNPWGLNNTMTTGIVSAVGRQLPSAELIDLSSVPGFQNPRIIQVDADLNPGNSGGPLFNSYGEVIGVNTAIRSNSGAFEGVGFAVPSNTVRRVVPELIRTGKVDYAWLGITTVASEFGVISMAEELGLAVETGVLVTGVSPDSPADEAGLLGGTAVAVVRDVPVCAGGDIILAVDGSYINNMDELVYYLNTNTVPGDVIELLVVRGADTFDVSVTLGSRPTSGSIIPACGADS